LKYWTVNPMTEINGHELKRRQFAEKIQALMQSEQPDAFTAFSVLAFVLSAYIVESCQPMSLEQEFQKMLKRALDVTYENKTQNGKETK